MKSVLTKISALKTNPSNPRIIKDDKFQKLVKSIKDFPQMLEIRPVVVNDGMMVLGGNMRLKAALEAGLKEIPVIKASQLTPEQQKEFIIKDNVGFGEWDWDTIANEWDVEQVTKWGLDIPDFALKQEATEDDYEIPDEIETDIVLGDLFEIGEHRLICGDSTDSDAVGKVLNKQTPNMIWSDPPYNALKSWNKSETKGETRLDPSQWFGNDNMSWEDYKVFLSDFMSMQKALVIYVCCDFRVYEHIKEAMIKNGYKIKHCIVWKKNVFGLGKKFRFQHEFIVYGELENAKFYGSRSESDVWEANVVKDGSHNTPKPVALPAKAITCSTLDNCIVYDPFLGSGTAMVASHQLNRKCYGMEIDPKYCQVIIDRMLKLDPKLIIKRNGTLYESAELQAK